LAPNSQSVAASDPAERANFTPLLSRMRCAARRQPSRPASLRTKRTIISTAYRVRSRNSYMAVEHMGTWHGMDLEKGAALLSPSTRSVCSMRRGEANFIVQDIITDETESGRHGPRHVLSFERASVRCRGREPFTIPIMVAGSAHPLGIALSL